LIKAHLIKVHVISTKLKIPHTLMQTRHGFKQTKSFYSNTI